MSERRRHKDQDVEGSRRVCTCDDETPELTTRRIFAQCFRSFVTLDIWLCHFRVPRAVTGLAGLGAYLCFGLEGAGVFLLTLALYCGMTAASGDFAPARQVQLLQEVERYLDSRQCKRVPGPS